jgi:glutathione peroxidase
MTALQEIPVTTIAGTPASLADHAGEVLLVVNVASQCGLTPQYTALEQIYEQYRDRGFSVLGFPANNFGAQEPGTDEEIAEFCSTKFSVAFPMFSKISVVGEDQHPLYGALTAAAPRAAGDPDAFRDRLKGFGMTPNNDPDILWNFEKFLVDRSGNVVARFAPTVTPDDPIVTGAIENALG